MNFYKIIDISNNKILTVAQDIELIYIKNNNGDLVALKDATKSNPCGFVLKDQIYFLENSDYPVNYTYPIVFIKMIGLDEYSKLKKIFINSDDNTQSGIVENISTDETTLEALKDFMINNMQKSCKQNIIEGIDIKYSDTMIKHFDLTVEDQLNLNTLRYKLLTSDADTFAYHSKNDDFEYYTKQEVKLIIEQVDRHILYHTAYFNSLKKYINSLTSIDEINKITYGQDFPDMYKSDVLLEISDK